ncbi:DUF4365 domain-containing protein [Aphanothece sacrum]|uniref:DUF4365 domain-containing protein n=1 Tax=Aphanothece sacrum FPU1 TaxID=1920663 RepID=A0A401IG73_APHSA|nr:DUF4365 domain-containing protein [Aphanothece sacrum]GBF80190.1 hypothetical protein AsFPU1_1591 [Aphanothece sacrum FPU1]GBF85343.1 hypothetical protein AsFPU3_2402 [Aphanothece sacrum FPU3]
MDLNTRKEMFSYAYIEAVSSVAGYSVELKPRAMDNAGIDVTIEVPGEAGGVLFPRIDAQVKCTAAENIRKENCIKFPLPVKNYKTLIYPNPYVPLILVVVLVPSDINDWLKITEEDILMKKCGYWLSLRGQSPTNNTENITVELPRQNLFTPVSLRNIMEKAGRRENL